MERLNVLVSDLDGTLLGDNAALSRFAEWYEPMKRQYRLVYASGRFVSSILESISRTQLPQPDAIIGGLGTEIFEVSRRRRMPLWPPLSTYWNPFLVRSLCESYEGLTVQPREYLSYYKISYFAWNIDPELLERLSDTLERHGQLVELVYSSRRDLDIVPAGVSKGAATDHVVRRWRLDPRRVCVAGNTGNDASMFQRGFQGVVVANADADLKSLDSVDTYHASRSFADGVIEGLNYWFHDQCELPIDITA